MRRPVTLAVIGLLLSSWSAAALIWVLRAEEVPPHDLAPWSSAAGRQVLAEWGVPAWGSAVFLVLLSGCLVAVSLLASVALLRTPLTWYRTYVAVTLVLFATAGGAVPLVLAALYPAVGWVTFLQLLAWVALYQLAYLFPDGRWVPTWSRWVLLVWASYLVLLLVTGLTGGTPRWWPAAESVLVLAVVTSGVGAQVYRYRRVSTDLQRRQALGLFLALAAFLVLGLVSNLPPLRPLSDEASGRGLLTWLALEIASVAVLCLIPVAVTVAVVRHRLFDSDLWVRRGAVYAVLTAMVIVTYLVVVGGLGAWWAGSVPWLTALTTAVVALAFNPVRSWLQRAAQRWVFGQREEPYAVVEALGARLAGARPLRDVAQTVVSTIGPALHLAGVRLVVRGEPPLVATHGQVDPSPTRFPVEHHGERLGELAVTLRPGDRLTSPLRSLLTEVARQVGQAIATSRLTADLRESRERLVAAREEERRRLHRDLHDGLGPTLAGLYQRLDAAGELIGSDPHRAAQVIAEVQEQTRASLRDLRQLVYALRPPALDEMGLTGAVREAARALNDRPGLLTVDVEGTQDLGDLPAGAEVAAYRIVMEAVTNVLRHSAATHCTVVLRRGARSCRWRCTTTGPARALAGGPAAGSAPCANGLRSWAGC